MVSQLPVASKFCFPMQVGKEAPRRTPETFEVWWENSNFKVPGFLKLGVHLQASLQDTSPYVSMLAPKGAPKERHPQVFLLAMTPPS